MHRHQCNAMRYDAMRCTAVAAVVDVLAQDDHQEIDAKRCKEIKTKGDKNKEAAGNSNTVNNNNNTNSIAKQKKKPKRKREKKTTESNNDSINDCFLLLCFVLYCARSHLVHDMQYSLF